MTRAGQEEYRRAAAYQAAYRQAHRARRLAQMRAWHAAHGHRVAKQRKAKRDWLDALKLARGCEFVLEDGSICGWHGHPAALEFDHRDPSEKKFSISESMGRSRLALLAEIEKCDVICANHHRIRTVNEGHCRIRRTSDASLPVDDDDPQLSLFGDVA